LKWLFLRKIEKMKETSVFKQLDFMMLPTSEHTSIFENEFMLADNFGMPSSEIKYNDFAITSDPFKIDFTLILFCTQGHMDLRLNLQDFRLQAGSVLVVLPNSIGECIEISDDFQLALIAFTNEKYADNIDLESSIRFIKYLSTDSLIPLTKEQMDESLFIYNAMQRKMRQRRSAFTREILSGYMQVLCYSGCQWMSEFNEKKGDKSPKNRQQSLFERFLELVKAHYANERSISFYAGKMCLTPKYLSLAVRQASGRSAGDWIRDYVILEAKALLKSKTYTVQQVSIMLNFANASFFGKYFKSATGVSPRRYMLG